MSGNSYIAPLAGEPAPGWQFDGACAEVDPEAWFPDRGSVAPPAVLAICAACPVRRSCLASALHRREHGVRAGTTAEDRETLTRLLRVGVSVPTVLNLGLAQAAHKQGRGPEEPPRRSESQEAQAA